MRKFNMPYRPCLPGALCASLLFVAVPAACMDWQFEVGAGTHLIRRGVTYSDEGFVQARASAYAGNGWFVGISGANVRPEPYSRGLQVLADLGYGWPLADGWEAQLAVTHYDYLGHAPLRAFKYDDLTLTVDYKDLIFFSVAASPNNAFLLADDRIMRGKTVSYDLVLRYPLTPGWIAHAGVGHATVRTSLGSGYTYGDVGISRQVGRMQAGISYIATGSAAKERFGPSASNRWVASMTHHF